MGYRQRLTQAERRELSPGNRPDFWWDAILPIPTSAPPGSPAKVEVMAGRADKDEQLFHPLDASLRESDARIGFIDNDGECRIVEVQSEKSARMNGKAKRRRVPKYPGVRQLSNGRWMAQIADPSMRNGHPSTRGTPQAYLGTFDTEEEAAEAYQEAKERLQDGRPCIYRGLMNDNGVH
jgi:hypothetical protein